MKARNAWAALQLHVTGELYRGKINFFSENSPGGEAFWAKTFSKIETYTSIDGCETTNDLV